MKRRWFTKKRFLLPFLMIVILSGVLLYHTNKPLPKGLSFEGEVHQVEDADFIYNLTYNRDGKEVHEEEIFKRIHRAIEEADEFIVMDMFLYSGYEEKNQQYPDISRELTKALIKKKESHPSVNITVISDEVNTTYGSHPAEELELLKEHGIQTIITKLEPLRDSTPLYSAVWRTGIQWFGQSDEGWMENPMASTAPKVTLRSYMRLLNVKANHRKVLATDKTAIISSANPHDASAYHSNVAVEIRDGGIIDDVVKSEQAVAGMSGGKIPSVKSEDGPDKGKIKVQLLTEGKIYKQVLSSIQKADKGDEVWLGMFYLADPDVIDELEAASQRGANIRMILDPNQNAFGREKIGLPNRPVARKLKNESSGKIAIRWYNTGKEQYHPKMLFIKGQKNSVLIAGSANFTKRNLDDMNLESDVMAVIPNDHKMSKDVSGYFKRLWNNEEGQFTLPYKYYEDKTTPVKGVLYNLQEILGFSTY